ncbi:MAG: hypothetical protein HQ498_11130 [Pseudohongiella sp.]|nr:hypothetical protein [Pseudohongiella sp.]
MRILLVISLLSMLSEAASGQQPNACEKTVALEGPCAIQATSLKMNDLQAAGSHNSYKLAIPPVELALIRDYNPDSADSLDYSHLTLTNQLELGMRQIELDIVYDPEGGRYADPLLPRQTATSYGAQPYDNSAMHAPGFKVLHSQDIDVRSSCATWILCLTEIRNWSQANPEHVPILIMFNAKEGGSAYAGVKLTLDFTTAAYEALDAETLSVFDRSEIITPDDVRGTSNTLRDAVLAGGWPSLNQARGKVFFAMDERPEKVAVYMRGHGSLEGLPFFVNSIDEEADHAAYFTINNPLRDQDRIRAAVRAGFIVRTRADADTREARSNSSERREAAFASGAQYISTDYYVPRLAFSSYSVQLPGKTPARCNPVRRPSSCNQ